MDTNGLKIGENKMIEVLLFNGKSKMPNGVLFRYCQRKHGIILYELKPLSFNNYEEIKDLYLTKIDRINYRENYYSYGYNTFILLKSDIGQQVRLKNNKQLIEEHEIKISSLVIERDDEILIDEMKKYKKVMKKISWYRAEGYDIHEIPSGVYYRIHREYDDERDIWHETLYYSKSPIIKSGEENNE